MAPMQIDNDADSNMSMINPIPRLPVGTRLSYLAEGGANIVYRIFLPDISNRSMGSEDSPGTGTEDEEEEVGRCMCAGKLLRLRKMIDSGTPYIETARSFRSQIKELFRDDELLDQDLVRLPKNFIASCNEELKADEASDTRPKSRRGVYLSTKEPFGLLITDMTPAPGSGEVLWEFKPKWLVQSPSAPNDAVRCRTCALREMKNNDGRKKSRGEDEGPRKPQKQQQPQQQPFCPLDLVSDNFGDVLRAARYINNAPGTYRVASFLYRNPTLIKLRECQQRMNAVGLPGLQAQCRERAISMTLRDCTMYVKVPFDYWKPLEVRLGDLDFKSGVGGKLQYWREIETRLITEGWYNGTGRGQENSECSLQQRRSSAQPSSSENTQFVQHIKMEAPWKLPAENAAHY